MEKQYDSIDAYYILIHKRILQLAPVTGILAALTFTAARLAGLFQFVEITPLICFDLVCLSYFIVAGLLMKKGIAKDGIVSKTAMLHMNFALDALVLVQWNLISYIFPTKTFWGFAPMFVMLCAFLFQTKAVMAEIIGMSVSIALSWFIKGDQLLPARDELFQENMSLRIVALVVSFSVIYILTFFAEKFTRMTKDNFLALEEKNSELRTLSRDIIDFTANIIEERDATSGSHVKRLKTYTRILAEQVAKDYPVYGLTEEKIEQITMACVLHDVGKIGIPDSILQKPGRLTAEEYAVMKTHATLGARIIDKLPDSIGEEYKNCCREICQFHHERYDGGGYPAGLKGDDIPISAQIVSVVDCFDALSSERPYKEALPGEVAINMILNGECGEFSVKMKACIIACKSKLLAA